MQQQVRFSERVSEPIIEQMKHPEAPEVPHVFGDAFKRVAVEL